MTDYNFSLRELQPSDSPALVKLISSFDGDMTTQFQVDAYSALIFGTENLTLGVGVECAGVDGLVGMGTVRFSQVCFNGESFPLAFLDGLKVGKDFRGQGLGHQIASWRIQRARETWGEDCVIATGLLRSNAASRAVARKWCCEFIDIAFQPLILPVRNRPPKPLKGVQVRELALDECEQFAFRQNAYYQSYNLYPSVDVRFHDSHHGSLCGREKTLWLLCCSGFTRQLARWGKDLAPRFAEIRFLFQTTEACPSSK